MTRHVTTALAILLTAVTAASAHHSFASQFDAHQPFTIAGVVTKIDWQNPHSWFYVDVVDEKTGKTANWAIELGSPNGLRRAGWTRDSLKIGDHVTVEGSRARDGSLSGNPRRVIQTKTGQPIFGSSTTGTTGQTP